jgi:flagellar biosynthesis anti-sigma factor FlgM
MRIDFSYTPQAATEANGGSAKNNAAANATNPAAESGEDQAVLSSAHLQIASLSAQAAQLPEVREQKVQALRQAVETGRYRPEPDQTAGALIAHLVQNPAA